MYSISRWILVWRWHGMDNYSIQTQSASGGQGGTPFGAFPTMFPMAVGKHMVEAIISDYTINSLFYWMHKCELML